MLGRKIALHDIKDVEAFVIMCLKRSGCGAPPEHWDDLICEGIVLLYRMAGNYKPRMNGHEVDGRFSGYAVMWLPKQINQAWHKSQAHHLYAKDDDGNRGWTYRLAPVSYELIAEEAEEMKMLTMNEWVEVPQIKGLNPAEDC